MSSWLRLTSRNAARNLNSFLNLQRKVEHFFCTQFLFGNILTNYAEVVAPPYRGGMQFWWTISLHLWDYGLVPSTTRKVNFSTEENSTVLVRLGRGWRVSSVLALTEFQKLSVSCLDGHGKQSLSVNTRMYLMIGQWTWVILNPSSFHKEGLESYQGGGKDYPKFGQSWAASSLTKACL